MSEITNYLKKWLNEVQFQAASHTDTSSLILAWAWSWKTRTLTYKIANLIFGKSVKPRNILAVTFTNKAANEMKQRLLEIWEEMTKINNKDEELDFDAIINWQKIDQWTSYRLSPWDLKWVWTFHSIFLKILKEDIEWLDLWYTKDFWVYDENESISLLKETLSELKLADQFQANETKRAISSLKNKSITYQKNYNLCQSTQEEIIAKIYEKYQKKLQKANSLDFDDLLLLPKILFDLKSEILEKRQKRFQYILVDEAQDTNQLQFDLIRQLAWKKWNVTFIWDDYQSIYGWRWAVMDNFLNISTRWPDVKIFKLEINYRSRPHIVQAWNHVIAKNTKQYQKDVVSNRTWEDKIRLFWFSDETDEAMSIIEIIKKMKQEKNFSLWSFAILYRTNAQSQPFEQILINEWIPYKIWWWFKFFERIEIKDIISYIKYILNPRDSVSLKRIINTPNRKIWKTSIEKLEELAIANWQSLNDIIENIDKLPVKLTTLALNNLKNFNTLIKFTISQLQTLLPSDLISNLVSSIKYKEYLVQSDWLEKAEERMGNIWQLINMASKYNEKWEQSLRQFLEEIALMTDLEENTNGNVEAVQLMSVHASKGLEFPVVFISGLEENMFPLPKAKFDQNELEEERRLMYVAVTRAKDILFMSYANSRKQRWQTKYNEASRFLEEIPPELINSYNLWNKTQKVSVDLDEWDVVRHKLFGKWTVLEVWNEVVVVRFWNEKYGIRRLDIRFIEKE